MKSKELLILLAIVFVLAMFAGWGANSKLRAGDKKGELDGVRVTIKRRAVAPGELNVPANRFQSAESWRTVYDYEIEYSPGSVDDVAITELNSRLRQVWGGVYGFEPASKPE